MRAAALAGTLAMTLASTSAPGITSAIDRIGITGWIESNAAGESTPPPARRDHPEGQSHGATAIETSVVACPATVDRTLLKPVPRPPLKAEPGSVPILLILIGMDTAHIETATGRTLDV